MPPQDISPAEIFLRFTLSPESILFSMAWLMPLSKIGKERSSLIPLVLFPKNFGKNFLSGKSARFTGENYCWQTQQCTKPPCRF